MTDANDKLPSMNTEALLAALPVPALLLSSDRVVLASNGLAQAVLKAGQPGEVLSRSIRNPTLLEAVDQVLAGSARGQEELQLGTSPPLTYEVSITPLTLGGARHALVVFIDLTSARQAEAMRSAFVANVSHELRSPLTTLMGAVEALEGPAQDDPEGRKRMLALMDQEARRMKNLIDDLLSLSRVEAQEFIPPGQEVSLKPLLEGARERLLERATSREMMIEMVIDENLPMVPGVDDELFQVFDNLISNAIKYGARGSVVSVTAMTADGGVRVSIHNAGDPIPSEHLPRLTERFYRVDKSRSRELGGTGLGLAIVKHIVSRHRSTISVESSAEAGTTFSLVLPVNT